MKKKVVHLVSIFVIVLAFIAVAPSSSFAASNLVTTVDKAVIQMQKAYHTYSDVTATGKFADINAVYKEYNAAKAAYANAKAAVVKAGGSQKTVLLAKLDANYKTYITTRVIPYIDAYNYMTRDIISSYEGLKTAKANKNLGVVATYYDRISYQLGNRTAIIYRVYGKTTRDLFLSIKDDAEQLRNEFIYDVRIYIDLQPQIDTLYCEEVPHYYLGVTHDLPYVSETFKDYFIKLANEFKYDMEHSCKQD